MGIISEIILNPIKFLIYLKWMLRYLFKGNWCLGTEMAYWEYEVKYSNQPKYLYEKLSLEIMPLLNVLGESFGEKSKPYNLLEIGPGPRTFLTEGYRRKLFNLKGIDPLANNFKKYLGGNEFLVQGTCEELNIIYPPKSFHITYAKNSLDHVKNPSRCFQNIVNATVVKGFIFIQGNIKEGSRLNWVGLHRYDLWIEQGKLMCAKRDGEPIDLIEGLPIELYSYQVYEEISPSFSIIYRRTN